MLFYREESVAEISQFSELENTIQLSSTVAVARAVTRDVSVISEAFETNDF